MKIQKIKTVTDINNELICGENKLIYGSRNKCVNNCNQMSYIYNLSFALENQNPKSCYFVKSSLATKF